LYEWIEFLREQAIVVAITVPSHISDSFRMFETLNARGVRASQVDILKNYLFNKASHSPQIGPRWISMLSTIESYGSDALVLNFIRHFWISQRGPTTHDELGENIEKTITKSQQALEFVAALDTNAETYIAVLTPLQHPFWNGFPPGTRQTIDIIINQLEAVQIRPLMLAIAHRFGKSDAFQAFQMFVSWSVRFLIVGGGGGGKLDRYYGMRAQQVTAGTIKTAKALAESMADVVPGNTQFQEEFGRANVRAAALARYYLRALQLYGDEKLPQLLINEDPLSVNLEHVLPIKPSDEWDINVETAATFHKRLGNMVLLGAKDNVTLGNGSFKSKRKTLQDSPFSLTRDVGLKTKWGPDQIRERQLKLAEIAPKVWPL